MEMDTTGNITFANKFALDFFGFQEQEIWDAMPPKPSGYLRPRQPKSKEQ
jgi:hypothetical protein